MLWKFYKTDPDICSYLFGTMHLATEEAYTFVNIAQKYIDKVSSYAGEMDLNEATGKDMMSFMTLPDGVRFSSFFRPKQYAKYKKLVLKTFKIDLISYDTLTPFFMNNLLAELTLPKSKNEPLDHFLWNYAMEKNKKMKGVESFENQLNVLRQIPLDYQIKAFRRSLKNIGTFKSKLKKINEIYSTGDINKIYKISKKSMGSIRKLMIYDRNTFMAEKIIQLASKMPLFAAVGAAHLAGKNGLIALLKKEGFNVQPVSS